MAKKSNDLPQVVDMPVNKGGRPHRTFDWDIVKELCKIHCTRDEIYRVMGSTIKTFEDACQRDHGISFNEFYETHSADGKKSIRHKQFQLAMEGDRTMLIWLGKQWLGQQEKIEHSANEKKPLMLAYKVD